MTAVALPTFLPDADMQNGVMDKRIFG